MDGSSLSGDDVTGLIRLGCRETIDFAELQSRILFVGRLASCQIVVDDEHVSARQFALVREESTWRVTGFPDTKNPTFLNGVPTGVQEVALHPGAVIRVGGVAWVTSGSGWRPGEWLIAARNRDEFYAAAYFAYGTVASAAEAIGVDESTYRRALQKIPEVAEAIAARGRGRPSKRKKYICPAFGVPVPALAARTGISDGVPLPVDGDD